MKSSSVFHLVWFLGVWFVAGILILAIHMDLTSKLALLWLLPMAIYLYDPRQSDSSTMELGREIEKLQKRIETLERAELAGC